MNWISVKDRLPENYTRVLAFKSLDEETCVYDCVNAIGGLLNEGYQFWMPLPEPPKQTETKLNTKG